jgi:hypothetical protein
VTLVGAVVLALVLVAAAAVVGVGWWQRAHRTELQQAMAWAPDGTARYSWTDWSAVRSRLGAELTRSSSGPDVADFLSDAYDADLSSQSAMNESAETLQESFGFSPATASWELLSQSTSGSVLLVGLPDSISTGSLGDTFESLGYDRPSSDDGVWFSTESQIAGIGGTLSPQFNYLALDDSRHLLMASDNAAYLAESVRGLDDSPPDDQGVTDVAAAVGTPLTAAVYSGAQACKALAMAQADDDDQATADQLVAAAGGVHPLSGFAMASEPSGHVTVALGFEADDQARADADSRSKLASGPAVGQGGDFADRFDLGPVTADGRVVTLDLEPVDDSPIVSDLSTGPVLFATC